MPIAAIIALIQAVPSIVSAGGALKDFITSMFTAKLITPDQQNALHQYVDALQALALAGIKPANWQVDSDPTTTPKP